MVEILKISPNKDGFSLSKNVKSNLIIEGTCDRHPKVSIMIPTYRRPAMLLEAISSARFQSRDISYEIIIVDNNPCPIDGAETEMLVRSLNDNRISLYRNTENIGLFGNWNRCIFLARAEWLTILNDDDLLNLDWLKRLYPLVEKNEKIGAFGCSIQSDAPSFFHRSYFYRILQFGLFNNAKTLTAKDYFLSCPHSGSLGVLINKQYATQIGGFNPEFYPCADYLFFAKLCLTHKIILSSDTLAVYRKYWTPSDDSEQNLSGTSDVFVKTLYQNWTLQNILMQKCRLPRFILRYYTKLFATQSAYKQRKNFINDPNVIKFYNEKSIILKNNKFKYLITKLFILAFG